MHCKKSLPILETVNLFYSVEIRNEENIYVIIYKVIYNKSQQIWWLR